MKTNQPTLAERISSSPELLQKVARRLAFDQRHKLEWEAAVEKKQQAHDRVNEHSELVAAYKRPWAAPQDLREKIDAAVKKELETLKKQAGSCNDAKQAADLLRRTEEDVLHAQRDLAAEHLRIAEEALKEVDRELRDIEYEGRRYETINTIVAKHALSVLTDEIEALAPELVPILGILAEIATPIRKRAVAEANGAIFRDQKERILASGERAASAGPLKHIERARFEIDLSDRHLPGLPDGWLDNIIRQASATLEKDEKAA